VFKKIVSIAMFTTVAVFAGKDVNELDSRGATPLTCAIEKKDFDEAIRLIGRGGRFFVSGEEYCLFHRKLMGQNKYFLKLIIEGVGLFSEKNRNTLNEINRVALLNKAMDVAGLIHDGSKGKIEAYICSECLEVKCFHGEDVVLTTLSP
jgi:hypothetical protein